MKIFENLEIIKNIQKIKITIIPILYSYKILLDLQTLKDLNIFDKEL